VGEPLCLDCYDYVGQVLFTWHAPELWHRFTINLRRQIGRQVRAAGQDATSARLSYVKVVELQRRGVPHYHSIVRLDPHEGGEDVPLSTVDLVDAVRTAAVSAHLEVGGIGGELVTVRFGQQIDVAPIPPEHARRLAGYLAKYVTKSVADLGVSARQLSVEAIDDLAVSEHVRRILRTIVVLAEQPGRADMARSLHTLGYRGHISSKTRRYSTTMTALRARRAAFRSKSSDDAQIAEPAAWQVTGHGHRNAGERYLVMSAAERARESRIAARAARIEDTDAA
jgi:hypothetical protein